MCPRLKYLEEAMVELTLLGRRVEVQWHRKRILMGRFARAEE